MDQNQIERQNKNMFADVRTSMHFYLPIWGRKNLACYLNVPDYWRVASKSFCEKKALSHLKLENIGTFQESP